MVKSAKFGTRQISALSTTTSLRPLVPQPLPRQSPTRMSSQPIMIPLRSPTLSPILRPTISKRMSSASLRSFVSDIPPISICSSYASSTASIPFVEGEVDVVTEEGVGHSEITLEAKKYKSSTFGPQLLAVLQTLRVPKWYDSNVAPDTVKIFKVSGSLTNAVFFVSCPSLPHLPTLLLRIYGPSSGSLISRPRELHTLHILSSQYHIGPRVYGTFGNGRVEEYFESTTLTASDLRDINVSRWIGARMAELHCVDIEAVEETSPANRGEGKGWQIGAKKNVRAWLSPAREVLAIPSLPAASRQDLDLDVFMAQWEKYMTWLKDFERKEGKSRRVFAHNDAQYGNLLRLKSLKEGMPEHRQIIVVDFEYASPNPAAFDIANHFHEWTSDYHSSTPHILNPARYPTLEQRTNFYLAYMEQTVASSSSPLLMNDQLLAAELTTLDRQVQAWSPASHAMWAVWGLVQARDDLERTEGGEPEFDYIGYSQSRMQGFRREIHALGL